jgi:hypothetical protein
MSDRATRGSGLCVYFPSAGQGSTGSNPGLHVPPEEC